MDLIKKLNNGFELHELSRQEFSPLLQQHFPALFDDQFFMYRWDLLLSEEEQESREAIKNSFPELKKYRYAIFKDKEFVGASFSYQTNVSSVYMQSSAILPEYRRQGLYSQMLGSVMQVIERDGFQEIQSNHHMTNNPVIIAKLKKGFNISGVELSDRFGTLVNLKYYTNSKRREVCKFRSGEMRPSKEQKQFFKL